MSVSLQATLQAWRKEAQDLTAEVRDPIGLEWLSGRISGMNDILALLDGDDRPEADLRHRLLPPHAPDDER